MNKGLLIVLGILLCVTSIGCAKVKNYNEYKRGLEVELKVLSGKQVNELLKGSDANYSTRYLYCSIRNKFKGVVYSKLQIIPNGHKLHHHTVSHQEQVDNWPAWAAFSDLMVPHNNANNAAKTGIFMGYYYLTRL